MSTLADLRSLLEDSPDVVVLALISRSSTEDQVATVFTKAENTIANFNPAGWRCLNLAPIPEPPDPGDAQLTELFTLLHTEDPEVDGVMFRVGEGLNRPASYYALKELDSGLELMKAFSTEVE